MVDSAGEDKELVRQALLQTSAYTAIVKKYEQRLLRYVQRISGLNQPDAEDIVQEIFIKAYLNLNAFALTRSFSAWLYSIAHNETVSFWRKHKQRLAQSDLNDEVVTNLASTVINAGQKYDNTILKKHIIEVLNQLSAKYQEVLELYYLEEYNYEEISDIIKKPVSTVGTLLRRAKQQFKEQYIKHYGTTK
ncbi:MAG: RNA polymerase sigma factor [Patescibacteria group bacterium]|jgi:RNA polymerase sigma-70 factor (ECF subfamily)